MNVRSWCNSGDAGERKHPETLIPEEARHTDAGRVPPTASRSSLPEGPAKIAVGPGDRALHLQSQSFADSQATTTGELTAFPAEFVGYNVEELNTSPRFAPDGGGISLYSTNSGKRLRMLASISPQADVTSRFSFRGSGFQLSEDGSTLDVVATRNYHSPVHIIRVPVAGGKPDVLAAASNPAVSANNKLLAYCRVDTGAGTASSPRLPTVGILDLHTGVRRLITIAGMRAGQAVRYPWLPDSTSLFLDITDVDSRPRAAIGPDPLLVKNAHFTSRAELYDCVTG